MKFKRPGISIEILRALIERENPIENKNAKPRRIKNSFSKGSLLSDWNMVSLGMDVLQEIANRGFSRLEKQLLAGNQDVTKMKKEVNDYKSIINDFIVRIANGGREEEGIRRRIDSLLKNYNVAQAARDGIIVKKVIRREKTETGEVEIPYDTSMTSGEVIEILDEYTRQLDKLQWTRVRTMLELGLGVAGMLRIAVKGSNAEEKVKNKGSIVGIGTAAVAGVKLIREIVTQKHGGRQEQYHLVDTQKRMRIDLLGNEQISDRAAEDAVGNIKSVAEKERKVNNQIENETLMFDLISNLAITIISGIYVNRQIETKANGKIDGKSLAAALISLQEAKTVSSDFVSGVQGIQNINKQEAKFREIRARVLEINKQMEEKVYPLEGAKSPFEFMSIKNLEGRFYPKNNYETGEVEFATTIKIPEFSMKRGDVVLLSGESGAGKSTFLRLLKRGDINNRYCIELDNGEKVDNFGSEYISFKPDINLGNESSVLAQITGKESMSNLDENERKSLINILREMKFESRNILENLATKKFMEFSTGQQRRLALSKLFYRIDDGTSVIIVDEPVGNVQDELIREQLEMIKKYAQSRNVMLLLTTHRLDLAEDLATKRYHINRDGVLEQIPIKEKEKEEEENEPGD